MLLVTLTKVVIRSNPLFGGVIYRKIHSSMDIINAIGTKTVLQVPSLEEVRMDSLWAEQTVVINYFRRQAAVELSKISPLLKAHNVKLIGIGLEDLGVQEFLEGKYFDGDLYIDPKKEQYKALGYKRFNWCNIWCGIFSRSSKVANDKAKKDNIKGNLSGDGMQNGGMLIVKKGGTDLLLQYKMETFTDHVENAEILRILGIDPDAPLPENTASKSQKSAVVDEPKGTEDKKEQ